jgi:hypothetical protein
MGVKKKFGAVYVSFVFFFHKIQPCKMKKDNDVRNMFSLRKIRHFYIINYPLMQDQNKDVGKVNSE